MWGRHGRRCQSLVHMALESSQRLADRASLASGLCGASVRSLSIVHSSPPRAAPCVSSRVYRSMQVADGSDCASITMHPARACVLAILGARGIRILAELSRWPLLTSRPVFLVQNRCGAGSVSAAFDIASWRALYVGVGWMRACSLGGVRLVGRSFICELLVGVLGLASNTAGPCRLKGLCLRRSVFAASCWQFVGRQARCLRGLARERWWGFAAELVGAL